VFFQNFALQTLRPTASPFNLYLIILFLFFSEMDLTPDFSFSLLAVSLLCFDSDPVPSFAMASLPPTLSGHLLRRTGPLLTVLPLRPAANIFSFQRTSQLPGSVSQESLFVFARDQAAPPTPG